MLLTISLVINLVFLLPLTWSLARNAESLTEVYGPRTDARSILLSIYIAFAVMSAVCLMVGSQSLTAGLLLTQVIYKVLSAVTIGRITHPVVAWNLAIATWHGFALIVTGW